MAQSVKLKDGSYIDTEGIYDVTQGKTQKDVNDTQTSKIASLWDFADRCGWLNYSISGIRVYAWDDCIQFVVKVDGGEYHIQFYYNTKRIMFTYYDASTKTTKTLWNFT